ncbi:MAG: STAS domain-containing protein [Paludibacteraceae bacterium]|nr:STAS domain-containing protein [Paludibacteraceae bacterium]
MQINILPNGQLTRVCLIGELDTTATTEQTDELNQVIALADKALEIDCSELEYISSAGLRFFMQLKRVSEAKGGSIRISHLNEDVADIFRMSGFKNIFDIE